MMDLLVLTAGYGARAYRVSSVITALSSCKHMDAPVMLATDMVRRPMKVGKLELRPVAQAVRHAHNPFMAKLNIMEQVIREQNLQALLWVDADAVVVSDVDVQSAFAGMGGHGFAAVPQVMIRGTDLKEPDLIAASLGHFSQKQTQPGLRYFNTGVWLVKREPFLRFMEWCRKLPAELFSNPAKLVGDQDVFLCYLNEGHDSCAVMPVEWNHSPLWSDAAQPLIWHYSSFCKKPSLRQIASMLKKAVLS